MDPHGADGTDAGAGRVLCVARPRRSCRKYTRRQGEYIFTQTRGACSSARSVVHDDVIVSRRSIAGWTVLIS